MNKKKIIFFGSFQKYSVQVLEKLVRHTMVTAVVTTPPKPQGRHLALTPTETSLFAERQGIPVFALESLDTIPSEIDKPDLLIVAGYGKIIPAVWLTFPKIMALNMHASLLPQYRGAFPAEWAILRGETQTGVTLVKISEKVDQGDILAQKAIPIAPDDTRETLYRKLYELGANLLVETVPKIIKGTVIAHPQPAGTYFYAKKITREDGFIPWKILQAAMEGRDIPNAQYIERAIRALSPWPGIWTEINLQINKSANLQTEKKRLKILRLSLIANHLSLDVVQLEGKKPVSFSQFSAAYPSPLLAP